MADDQYIKIPELDPILKAEVGSNGELIVNLNGKDYKISSGAFLVDIINDLATTTPGSALDAVQGKVLDGLINWQNEAAGFIFDYTANWTLVNAGLDINVTIPNCTILEPNSSTPISITGVSGTVSENGGILLTDTSGVYSYTFVADLTDTAWKDGTENKYIIAKNLNGTLYTRNVSLLTFLQIPAPTNYTQYVIDPPVITDIGTVQWNNKEYTINVNTGLGATIQVGQETLLLYYNDTGAQIDNFTVLHPKGATEISDLVVPTPEKADASTWELCEGTLSVATHDIGIGELGFATRFGKASDGDSTGWTPGAQLWLSADGSGMPTITKPAFPDYSISIGGSLKEDASEGTIFVSITKSVADTFHDSWDGSIRESFDFLVTSNGSVVTGTLTNVNAANNLTLFFSDGAVFYTLDTTTAPLTVTLTPGTDSDTTTNYVYIPISTKVLTVSTSGFPTTEHCKVARLEVQSAATVQTELGAERNQNINDHIKTEDDNGHILHIAERIRQLNAEHDNGTEGSLTGTPTNGYIQVTGGQVWQLHKQTFASFSMPTRNIIIRNDFTTPNRRTNNLNTINAYSDGSSWNNEWSKVVVWGIVNKTGEPDFIKLNLPSAGYNSEANAIADALNYADYTIPTKYKGVGFLIAAFTVRISGGSITYNAGTAYQDLRGFVPNNIAGGGGGSGVTTLLGLTDVTTADYSGLANYQLTVNSGETGAEFTEQEIAGTGVTYGHISDQAQIIEGEKTFNASVEFEANVSVNAIDQSTSGDTVLVADSVGGLKFDNPAYVALTAGAAVTYNLNTGLNKTLNVAVNSTITFTNMASKLGREGNIRLNVTAVSDVDFAGSGVTFTQKGNSTSLPIGIYNVFFRVISATAIDLDINSSSTSGVFKTQNSITSAASITPIVGTALNEYNVTALDTNATINAPTGTASDGDRLTVRIKSALLSRTLTWNSIYAVILGSRYSLPSSTEDGGANYVEFIYNSQESEWILLNDVTYIPA